MTDDRQLHQACSDADQLSAASSESKSGSKRLAIFALVIVGLFVLSYFLPVGRWLTEFDEWVQEQGAWGAVWFGIVYIVCTVLFVPGSILTIGAGAIYGPLWGTILVSLASTTGAACAFLLGRYVARDQVHAWMQSKPRFAALDQAIALKGGWIVFLLRLSPIFPFNLLNYALGLTGVRFWPYVLASWIGMLPGTIAFVLLGYAGRQALAGEQQLWYWIIAAVVTLIATVYITRVATRVIRAATKIQ